MRRSIGYVAQVGSAPSAGTLVGEELVTQARLQGLSKADATERLRVVAPRLDLGGLEGRALLELSGGQRRRFDVALGLMHSPRLVFLDEPTTGLDPQSRANLWQHIRSLRDDAGVTIVLTTHYLDEADALADRVLVMDGGTIVADDTPEALKARIAGDVVTLALAADLDRAAATVRAAVPVREIVTTDTSLLVTVDEGATSIAPILRALDAAQLHPTSITVNRPTLDDVLFGPLLKNVTGGGLGGDDAWRVFVPGLLLQLAIFGGGFAGFGIIQELREGVIERQRVTPARRASLIVGRTLQNMVTIGVQAVVLVVVALPFGLSASWSGIGSSVVLICLLSLGISAASYAMGLILKDEDAFAPFIQGVSLPLLLLSGVLLPMSLAPAWLRHTSEANPLTYVVDASRALFRGDFGDTHVWVGGLITVALGALLAWWGTRTFQRQSA